MRFAPTDEQLAFSRSLDDLLSAADVPAASRAWGEGDASAGLDLWRLLAGLGVHALCVPEEAGGLDAAPIDVVVAFEQLGRHQVPGPYVESVVAAPALLSALDPRVLPAALRPALPPLGALAEGTGIVTLAAPPATPYALDADVAGHVLLLNGDQLHSATPGTLHRSVDATRRLSSVTPADALGTLAPGAVSAALDTATLACSAQLLGAGERLLAEAVAYAKVRRQFGRAIGEYQALAHALADVRVALDFARPLLYGAAVSLRSGSGEAAGDAAGDAARDVSAAKVATSEAAYLASRTALQVHGAIGYTLEYDLGLWITKVRALVGAWGTPAVHRARVLAAVAG